MMVSAEDMKSRYTTGVAYAAQNNSYATGINEKTPWTCGPTTAARWARNSQQSGTVDKWFVRTGQGLSQ